MAEPQLQNPHPNFILTLIEGRGLLQDMLSSSVREECSPPLSGLERETGWAVTVGRPERRRPGHFSKLEMTLLNTQGEVSH